MATHQMTSCTFSPKKLSREEIDDILGENVRINREISARREASAPKKQRAPKAPPRKIVYKRKKDA